jgi:hypothetical protein
MLSEKRAAKGGKKEYQEKKAKGGPVGGQGAMKVKFNPAIYN